MATANLGRVGIVNKGTYVGSTTVYKLNDVVKYLDKIYICTLGHSTENIPSNNSGYWSLWVDNTGIATQVSTIADLRAMTSIPSTVYVTGYTIANDNAFGSNFFKWNSTSTVADNGGTIIKLTGTLTGRYELQYSEAVNVKWFGTKGDGVTNDTTAIHKARDVAKIKKQQLYIPTGIYGVDGLVLDGAINYYGDGNSVYPNSSSTTLKIIGTGSISVFGLYQSIVSNLIIDTNGFAVTGLKIYSINPIRSVANSFEHITITDSTYSYNATGISVGDSTLNQVAETTFNKVYLHESLLNAVIHKGDNTVNIIWDNCLFSAKQTIYKIYGGGNVYFNNGCEFAVSTVGYSAINVYDDVGSNDITISTIPSAIVLNTSYFEMNNMQYIIDASNINTANLPSDTSGKYNGRLSIEFTNCGSWNSVPKTLVNVNATLRFNMTVYGGRFHNVVRFVGGLKAAFSSDQILTLINPTVTGADITTWNAPSYGRPIIISDTLQSQTLKLMGATSNIIQADNGSIVFSGTGGGAYFAIEPSSAGTFSNAWNGCHFKLGSYRLWVDANGKLMIKAGAPLSDTDGTIVGTQA